jgi:hypothetical protein
MHAAAAGRPVDPAELAEAERRAVTDVVARQRAAGLDMICDGGFSSQASYAPEVHPAIVWAKFEALAEGARRATARLW